MGFFSRSFKMKGRKQTGYRWREGSEAALFVCFYSNLMGETSHAKGQRVKRLGTLLLMEQGP